MHSGSVSFTQEVLPDATPKGFVFPSGTFHLCKYGAAVCSYSVKSVPHEQKFYNNQCQGEPPDDAKKRYSKLSGLKLVFVTALITELFSRTYLETNGLTQVQTLYEPFHTSQALFTDTW